MRLLKILVVIFIFYFVKRFMALYRELSLLKVEREIKKKTSQKADISGSNSVIIDADFRVIK